MNRWWVAFLVLVAGRGFAQTMPNSFEEDEAGKRPASVSAWAPSEGEGPGTWVVSTDRARTGANSLRFELPKGGYIVASQYVPVTAGTNYRFSAWVYLEPGTTATASTTVYWSAAGNQAGRLDVRHPGSGGTRSTGEWTEQVIVATAPPGTTHAQMTVRLSGRGTDGAGVALWDDLAIEEIADNLVLGPGDQLVEQAKIKNASFADGPEQNLPGWTLETENGEYAATREIFEDNPAAKLVSVGRGTGRYRGSLVSDAVRIGKPASHYRVSARVRGRHAMCRLLVHFTDAATGEKLNFWAANRNLGSSWNTVGGTIRILPQYRERELACRIELRLVGSGEAWFDDVVLEPVAAPDVYWKKDAVYRWDPSSPLLIPREPASGAVVRANPPAFVFPPVPEAKTYRVEWSDTPEFATVAGTSPVLDYNSYLHAEPLAADRAWYWRSVALDDAGQTVQTSDAWSFTIARDAVEWPFPPVAELARRAAPHPRLFVNPATLEQDRARVLADPRWPAYLAATEKLLDAPVQPEPVDFWDFDPWGEVYRGVYQPSQAMQRVYVQCAFAYLMTRDQRFLDKARQFMLEQAAWDPEGPTCFQWLDQVGRSIMLDMSLAYDWLYHDLTPAERATITDSLMGRIRTTYGTQRGYDCRTLRYYPRNSHGITILGMLTTTSLALLGDVPEADEIFAYVVPFYCAMFPPWGGDDGGWSEGVNYGLWSVEGHLDRWEAIRSALGIDLFAKPWYRNQPWWRFYCLPPFATTSWFGDGHPGRPGAGDARLMGTFASIYGNPYFRWYAETMPGNQPAPTWQDLLRYREVPPKPPADLAQARAFADVGWAFLHSDLSDPGGVMLGFKSSPHGSYSHSHADQNSFVLFAHGRSLAIDAGYYESYGSAHHYGYTKQTKSHNAVLVDGKGQAINDITSTGQLTGFVHGAGFDFVAGQAAAGYKGALESWERQILFVRPGLFVVVDELEAPSPATFQWLLHTETEPTIDPAKQTIETKRDGAFLHTALLWPGKLDLTMTDQFDPQPIAGKVRLQPQYHITAATLEPAARQRIVAVLAPVPDGGEPPAFALETTAGAMVLRGSLGNEEWLVLLPPPGGTGIRHGEWTSDAQLLAVGMAAGRLTRLCMVRGTVCRQGGTEWLRAAAPATASVLFAEGRTLVGRDPADTAPLRLRSPHAPALLFLDRGGKDPVRPEVLPDGGIELPAREWSEIYAGAKPAPEQSVELVSGDLRGMAQAVLSGQDRYVFATKPPAARGRYRVRLETTGSGTLDTPWPGIGRQTLDGAGRRLQSDLFWLTENTAAMTWDAGVKLERIKFVPDMPAGTVPVRELPEEAATVPGRVFQEAETLTDQERGAAKPYTHRAFLSNGTGLGSWSEIGHSLSWTVAVPQAGRYRLILKASVWEETGARRAVQLDGTDLNGGIPSLFPFTGGFGADPTQWKHYAIADADGGELLLDLSAGDHTLTLTGFGGGMNLDYLVLAPR